MFKRVDLHFLMTFEYHKIMPVSLMVTEKEILAVGGVNVFPIFQSKFDGRKRRMGMEFISKSMFFQKTEGSVYSFISCHHLLRLLA
jgi:hypothetical protein